MDASQYPLFQIPPSEFEKLAIDLLNAEGGRYGPAGRAEFDILGRRAAESDEKGKIAIEVKHRVHIQIDQVKAFIERASALPEHFSNLVFLTSAPITSVQRQQINRIAESLSGRQLTVIGQRELEAMLAKHRTIADKYFKPAAADRRKRILTSFVAVLAVIFSTLSYFAQVWDQLYKPEPSSFESRIDSVEQNLRGLKSLEQSLQGLKAQLQETSAETARIQLEYEEALKLKSFTDEEINRFKKAASTTSAMDTFLNYFYGFLLGVSGSILATIITDRWKTWRALNRT